MWRASPCAAGAIATANTTAVTPLPMGERDPDRVAVGEGAEGRE